jgi:hypothetical protein
MSARFQTAGLAVAVLAVGLMLPPKTAVAQSGSGDGFLFHQPKASLTLRIGVARPDAQDGVFAFTSDLLTVNRNDFTGFSAAANLDFMVTSRLAIEMGTGVSARQVSSEYRDWVDLDDLPIEQTTNFRRTPVTAGFKLFLLPTGRSLGRYAWVPNTFAPYISAGGGFMYYKFSQSGDFVDFQDNDVFRASLESSDWTSSAYGAVGFNYNLTAHAGIVTEARYEHANANMGRDFVGFPRINLSGWGVTTGLSLRF